MTILDPLSTRRSVSSFWPPSEANAACSPAGSARQRWPHKLKHTGNDAHSASIPLTLSELRWRQRHVWECVVMRRNSLQMAKEETFDAS